MNFEKRLERDIVISSDYNGYFIIKVGCCKRAYKNADIMLQDISEYINHTKEVENNYAAYQSMKYNDRAEIDIPIAQDEECDKCGTDYKPI